MEINVRVRAALFSQYLRTADFGDDLPGLVKDRQSLRLWGVGASQTAAQRPKQQMLERRRQADLDNALIYTSTVEFPRL